MEDLDTTQFQRTFQQGMAKQKEKKKEPAWKGPQQFAGAGRVAGTVPTMTEDQAKATARADAFRSMYGG